MASFHTQVKLDGFDQKAFQLTWNLTAGIVAADIGKALSINSAAANTLKLAADGDVIVGRLMTVEARTTEGTLVGTCEHLFAALLPIKAGLTAGAVVAVGSNVIGAGAGEIKATTAAAGLPFVAEVRGSFAVVIKF